MSVRSGENRKETEKLCAAGEREEARHYLVMVGVPWKATAQGGQHWRTVERYGSVIGNSVYEPCR
jgi:hypothetical protein